MSAAAARTRKSFEATNRSVGVGMPKAARAAQVQTTTAFQHIRDALTGGLTDAIADVNGETNRLARAFRQVQVDATRGLDRATATVKAKLGGLVGDRDGRSMGQRLASGIASGLRGSVGMLGSAVKGTLSAAFSKPMLVGVIVSALGGVAAVLGPALGTLLAGAMVLGVGGAVAGIGVALLAQDKKIKKQWTDTWTELKGVMTDAAKPLIPVMDTARKQLKSVVSELAPEIEKGFRSAQKPMQRFVKNLGEGFKNLAPAIEPLFDAFGKVLDELGPQLPGLFSDIADAFTDLANTVSDNRDLFAMVFMALLKIIPGVINGLAWLTSVFRTVTLAALSFFDTTLGAAQSLMETVAKMPGPWQDAAREIAGSIADTRGRLRGLRQQVEDFPKVVAIEGDIHDLQTKIADAKRRLRDPKLTRPERAKLRAEISQLQRAVGLAKAAIASVRGKTVTIRAVAQTASAAAQLGALYGRYGAQASGGIVGGVGAGSPRRMASGGQSGSSMTLVGEQGPELVRLPFGSSVTPAGQTRAALAAAGGGGGRGGDIHITLKIGATTLGELVIDPLRKAVRTRGGNVQAVLGR